MPIQIAIHELGLLFHVPRRTCTTSRNLAQIIIQKFQRNFVNTKIKNAKDNYTISEFRITFLPDEITLTSLHNCLPSHYCLPYDGTISIIDVSLNISHRFYRAMHYSAKRGIAIARRLSVCLSVRL